MYYFIKYVDAHFLLLFEGRLFNVEEAATACSHAEILKNCFISVFRAVN